MWYRFLISLSIVTGLLVFSTAYAGMYVYQLPDGSRIITDHAMKNSVYKLVRHSRNIRGIGILVASKNPQIFRPDYSNYDQIIKHAASKHRIEPALIKAVVHAESLFNPYATSKKGASGLMQLMPKTAERFGVTDIYDPVQNIQAGAEYLKILLKKYRKYNNKYQLALAAYNAGEGNVAKYKGIPPYAETQKYVKKVLRYKRRYTSMSL